MRKADRTQHKHI